MLEESGKNDSRMPGEKTVTIEKWMTSRIITIHQDDPVSIAFELLFTNDIRHLPVVLKDRKLVGIITDRDLNEAIIPADPSRTPRSMYHTVKNIKAKKIMTPNPITIDKDAPIREAAQLFLDRKIDCLPVKDGAGDLVGILTSTDILKAFIEFTKILGETRRIDVVMDTADYPKVLALLEKQGVSVVSAGITDDQALKKTVFSFRLEHANIKKITSLLRKKGYDVLSGN